MACRLVGAKPLSEPVLVLLLIRTLGTDKRKQITREINSFSLTKMRLKMSAKCRQFCLGLKVLNKEHVIKADLCQNLVFRTTENFTTRRGMKRPTKSAEKIQNVVVPDNDLGKLHN